MEISVKIDFVSFKDRNMQHEKWFSKWKRMKMKYVIQKSQNFYENL